MSQLELNNINLGSGKSKGGNASIVDRLDIIGTFESNMSGTDLHISSEIYNSQTEISKVYADLKGGILHPVTLTCSLGGMFTEEGLPSVFGSNLTGIDYLGRILPPENIKSIDFAIPIFESGIYGFVLISVTNFDFNTGSAGDKWNIITMG